MIVIHLHKINPYTLPKKVLSFILVATYLQLPIKEIRNVCLTSHITHDIIHDG